MFRVGNVELGSRARVNVDPPAAANNPNLFQGDWEEKLKKGDENAHLRRMARLLDHRAAVLVAGAAGMPSVHTVWVDCSPNRGWIDKLDERKLMNSAYSLADRDEQYMRRLQGLADGVVAPNQQANASEAISRHVLSVIKQYRKAIIASQVVCLAPVVETVMVELAQDIEPNLNLPRDSFEYGAALAPPLLLGENTEDHDLDVHDPGVVKMVVRVLRRHAEFAPRFCQAVGKIVAYRTGLQHGSATTTRRLQVLQVESVRDRRFWVEWMNNSDRLEQLRKIIARFRDTPENSAMTFDWVSEALLKLDREQQPENAIARVNQQAQPAANAPAAQPQGNIYML